MIPEYFLGITCSECDLFCIRGFPDLASAIAFCGRPHIRLPAIHERDSVGIFDGDPAEFFRQSTDSPHCEGTLHITELFKRMDPQIDVHSFPVGMRGKSR